MKFPHVIRRFYNLRIQLFLFHSGILSSISEIYNTDGILGFFSGLFPRLLGEILLTVFINTCLFLTKNVIRDSEVMKFGSIPIAVCSQVEILTYALFRLRFNQFVISDPRYCLHLSFPRSQYLHDCEQLRVISSSNCNSFQISLD